MSIAASARRVIGFARLLIMDKSKKILTNPSASHLCEVLYIK